ncbi:putative Dol-P-Glc:Glc(2)Man(9)GlcNAc(2)-PP-Dol alpha-1,2-glucosyltransferase [Mercenaria mercenaria]|uniref:putative Dol-P-Glc:Glc(2)Man(9)GlcNAc(2)-PP-Dol alpha-1,2-glucosyltransferase n=1 Tax=Mercenaria mercenaria TaxID=6596 RepID=UPI001E1DD0EF|nr:putative Dol-P-Glc:Glc(2)Man(9)GlcNAc(2)-PP-Dol alpha-1,2-glucosyltransferase [Mercenaria mercenaria]
MMLLLVILGILFCIGSLMTFSLVSDVQNKPYMDEVFHVPQAQQYCSANFTHWDPMITTLPGLYLMSVGVLKPVAAIFNIPVMELCTTYWLRTTNILFTFGNFYLIYAVLRKLHNPVFDPDGIKIAMTTLALSLLPVLYFFTFLYYTDPGSTFFVLIMYLFCLHGNHFMAAILGTAAIFFRQTNIIWVIFMAGLAVRKELSLWLKQICDKKDMKLDDLNDLDLLKVTFTVILDCAKKKRNLLFSLLLNILKNVWAYLLVGVGFGVFIILNKGIVVGDRTQHVAVMHFPQLFYFLTMTNFFAMFHLCSPYKVWEFLKFCIRHPLFLLSFTAVAFLMIHYFTYEHKYLLADNRHYAFYVWRKLYRRHKYVKYILIPAYLYFFWSVLDELKGRDIYWKTVYSVCVITSAVPQKLLEYRYFILPFLIFRMNMRHGTAVGLFHEILLYTVVNVLTVYMFVEKPYKWPHEDGIQRFMW